MTIPGNLSSGSLSVTGGWDDTFTVQALDPALTTIDCLGVSRPLTVASAGTSSLLVQSLTLTGGLTSTFGGGARLTPGGSESVTLDRLDVVGNSAVTMDGLSAGGGLFADLAGSNLVQATHCRIAPMLHERRAIPRARKRFRLRRRVRDRRYESLGVHDTVDILLSRDLSE